MATERKIRRKKKCKSCGEYFRPEGDDPEFIRWCSDECGKDLALKKIEKIKQQQARQREKLLKKQRSDDRKRRQELKPLSHWEKYTQEQYFNPYILVRDRDLPCISCGTYDSVQFEAGHFRSIGAASQLRFNEDNVCKQCHKCNFHLSGNREEYEKSLRIKIGDERVDALINNNDQKTWDRDDLKKLRVLYRNKRLALLDDY